MTNLFRIFGAFVLCAAFGLSLAAQGVMETTIVPQATAPLKEAEFISFVQRISRDASAKAELIAAVRARGIDFTLTNGLRSLVATKSGNDPELRRTLDEAARARGTNAAARLPNEVEAAALLEQARIATREANDHMPDFVVKQAIARYYSPGGLNNWIPIDRLLLAVSYRQEGSEEYKMLAVNDAPVADAKEGAAYAGLGGTSSTGEFVSVLAALFSDESKTEFRAIDTDTLRGHSAFVYEYSVETANSRQSITDGESGRTVVTGYRGRIWIDRETKRILRYESRAVDVPADFPITSATRKIDYDWVTISEKRYLLPLIADVQLTRANLAPRRNQYTRNLIRFRGYQKFGTDVKIIDDVDFSDEEPPNRR